MRSSGAGITGPKWTRPSIQRRMTNLLRNMKQLAQVYLACTEALEERKTAIRNQLKTEIYPSRLRFDLEALEREGIWRGFKFP